MAGVSNEDLLHEILTTRALVAETSATLAAHIEEEGPVLTSARHMIEAHGPDSGMIRVRVAFINSWMERERDRAALRKKIIESAAIWAILLMLGFIAYAVKDALLDIVRETAHHKEVIK